MKFSSSIITKAIDLKKYKYLIGIDPGVCTGMTVYSRWDKRIRHIATIKIHAAMKAVEYWNETYPKEIFVRVEDARQRKWFGKTDRELLQGAGSIKRDCKIWEDYLVSIGVDFEMVPPKNNKTKLNAEVFKKITGLVDKTTEHSRDSAMLVYKL